MTTWFKVSEPCRSGLIPKEIHIEFDFLPSSGCCQILKENWTWHSDYKQIRYKGATVALVFIFL